MAQLEAILKNTWSITGTWQKNSVGVAGVEKALLSEGSGARAVVYLWDGKSTMAHYVNAVNEGGVVKFLDGQVGGPANLTGAKYVNYLITSK
jgi:filamentous hemagglutinin